LGIVIMAEAISPNFEEIDLSSQWGDISFVPVGTEPESDVITLYSQHLRRPTTEEARDELSKTDCLLIRNEAGFLIAIRTFKSIMNHRYFDNYKNFTLGKIIVQPDYQKQGIGEFLTMKAVEFFDTQDQKASISMTIGTDAGAKLAAKVRDRIGKRLNVFDSR